MTLNHEEIKKNPQIITKIKTFTDEYNWKEIFYLIKKNWKKFELNNKSIVLNILYVPQNTEEIRHAYRSKYNLKCENQVILLMITDGKKWRYLAVKKLFLLLKGITSDHKGDFYCLNCCQSYSTKKKLKKHKDVCENHDYCHAKMPKEDSKILTYNHREKSMKVPFIIYADLVVFTRKDEHLS